MFECLHQGPEAGFGFGIRDSGFGIRDWGLAHLDCDGAQSKQRTARELADPEEARAQVREQLKFIADSRVLEFIKRVRAARG
jgi:hypothetical protein